MQTLAALFKAYPQLLTRSGVCVKVANEPFMALTVESIGAGATGTRMAVSICHYGKQNGDAMRDPEVCFEVDPDGGNLLPYYYRNDYAGVECESFGPERVKALEAFVRTWDRNLRAQGFIVEIEAGKSTLQS